MQKRGLRVEIEKPKIIGSNALLQTIKKFRAHEVKFCKAVTDNALKALYLDQRIPNDAVAQARDMIYLSTCSAYIQGAKSVFDELDKIK